jgi:hypothetical protein
MINSQVEGQSKDLVGDMITTTAVHLADTFVSDNVNNIKTADAEHDDVVVVEVVNGAEDADLLMAAEDTWMRVLRKGLSQQRCTKYYVEEFDDEYDGDSNDGSDDDSDNDSGDNSDDDSDENSDEDTEDGLDTGNYDEDDSDEECSESGVNNDSHNDSGEGDGDSNEKAISGKLSSYQAEDGYGKNSDIYRNDDVQESPSGVTGGSNVRIRTHPIVSFKNPGSLCYLISIVNQLLALPALEAATLSLDLPYFDKSCECMGCTSTDQTDRCSQSPTSKSVIDIKCAAQLQLLYAFMKKQKLTSPDLTPVLEYEEIDEVSDILPFAKSIRDFSGDKLSMHRQRDASDVLLMILGCIHRVFCMHQEHATCQNIFQGKLLHRLHASDYLPRLEQRREEQFFYLGVDVSSEITSLEASLYHYIRPVEFSMGWTIPEHGDCVASPTSQKRQLPTTKTCVFAVLPLHLIIHIKRFDFDHSKMKVKKKTGYFSFPQTLDMSPFLYADGSITDACACSGGTRDESLIHSGESNGSTGSSNTHSTKYSLGGIVIHEGSAQCGHYYSLVRERCPCLPDANFGLDETGRYNGSWYRLDDEEVSPFSLEELDAVAFGGCDIDGAQRQQQAMILIYDRNENTS